MPVAVRERFAGAEETARFRILFEGSVCLAWYLGEHFLRQTLGLPEQIVLGPPPVHMRDTERYTLEEMADYTIGWDAEGFRGEGDYTEYVQTYIMRPLNSGRRAERERPAAPVGAGAEAARVARVRDRSRARRGRGASWLALPTMMTCRGQGGKTYQIPFAPPPADHELVGFYDLPPVFTIAFCILHCHFILFFLIFRKILILLTLLQASSKYTRQSLELNASMMGILQRSFDLLAIYSIPVCSFDHSLKPYINCFT